MPIEALADIIPPISDAAIVSLDGITTTYNLDLLDESQLPIPETLEEQLLGNELNTPFQSLNVTTELQDVNIDISLLYDNTYYEKVLVGGKQLNAELTAQNFANTDKTIELLVILYSEDERMLEMKHNSETILAGTTQKFNTAITVPSFNEAHLAKVMLWDDFNSLKPFSPPIILTLESNDYFGDDYTLAQPLLSSNEAVGTINSLTDIDVFQFTPLKDGLYVFETYGETDTYASLFINTNLLTPIATDDNSSGIGTNFRLSATLTANQTYYLYIRGRNISQYTLKSNYAIGNIYGTISPVKYYDDDIEFSNLIESKFTLSTYATNEFIATMHLKDWSESTSQFVAFSLVGIHGGEYLATISRPGYLSRYLKISLNDNVIDIGNKVLLAGDVNGDNKIDTADYNIIVSLNGVAYGEVNYLVNADLNGDKIINSTDLDLVTPNLNKNSNIYNENVNIISVNATADGQTMTITGTARSNSTVNCTVYFNDFGVFSENVTCDATGQFQTTCSLSKTGAYTVEVSSSDRAFDTTTIVNY